MTDRYADVVIVGGAVTGSATAYFLAAAPEFKGRIVVIERDPSYAEAATGRSLGGMRQQFSTPENIAMSQFGIGFVHELPALLEVDGETPDVHFIEGGYLFLANSGQAPALQASHRIQREHGATVVLLDPAALGRRFPWLNLDGIQLGSFGQRREGWIDPNGLLHAFRRKARALGARYLHDEAVDLIRAGGRIAAVKLASGREVACGAVVNCAGARDAAHVARLAGIDLPVRPRKRQVYVWECREKLPGFPLIIDATGVYARPEGAFYVGGVSPPEDEDRDCADFELDEGPFEAVVWPTLAHRVPAFAAIKLRRSWCGHYDYNTLDQNAILGPHPEVTNFYFCNGFSGHGLQQAPAAGRALAELIVHGRYRTLDLSRLGFDRIRRNAPLKELAVV